MTLLARDLMQTSVHVVSPRMTLPELERELIARGVSGFPVVEGGKLVGIVSRSDIVRQLCAERSLAEIIADYQDVSDDTAESGRRAAASQVDVGDRVGRRIEQLRVGDAMIHDVVTVEPTAELVDGGSHDAPATYPSPARGRGRPIGRHHRGDRFGAAGGRGAARAGVRARGRVGQGWP